MLQLAPGTPFDPAERARYLELEASASAPYTGFVYASPEQAREVQAALFDADISEYAPRHSVVARGAEMLGMMTFLTAVELQRARMKAAMKLQRTGILEGADGVRERLKLAAGTMWRVPPDACYLARIAVASTARGSGIASKLLEELAARARAAGASRIVLEVDVNNAAARKLYARNGFEELSDHRVRHEDRTLSYVHAQRAL